MNSKEEIIEILKFFLQIKPEKITLHKDFTKKDGENFFGIIRSIEHPKIGKTYFVKNTIGKLMGHKGFNFSTIVKLLPQLYKNSIFIESQTEKEFINKNHKKHSNILFWHNTLNKFVIESDKNEEIGYYIIRFTVTEEYAGKKNPKGTIGVRTFHSANISPIKKDGFAASQPGTIPEAASPSDRILTHYLSIVK